MMRHQLDFFYVDDSVELESDLLRVGAKSTSLPSFRGCEEKRRNRVFLLVGTAGDYFELQFATHYKIIITLERSTTSEEYLR